MNSTVVGSPSRNAIVGFTRNDNGPAIDNLIVNMMARLEVKVQIPNDMVRTGNRTFSVKVTTSDSLVTIGQQNTALINVLEDDPSTSKCNHISHALILLLKRNFFESSWRHACIIILYTLSATEPSESTTEFGNGALSQTDVSNAVVAFSIIATFCHITF